jgi:peptide/nickel transport system ATP-binding protein
MSTGIPGHIPNYLNPPTGCRFHPRCKHKLSLCENKKPPLFNIDENHQVACWLFNRREK